MKTMEATRPHPPPNGRRLRECNGVRLSRKDITDRYGVFNARKILVHFVRGERN